MRGLVEAMEVHKVKTGYILTEDENEELSVKAGVVRLRSLQMSSSSRCGTGFWRSGNEGRMGRVRK
jgi:hypothetical protein